MLCACERVCVWGGGGYALGCPPMSDMQLKPGGAACREGEK
jgi:hypothetical protein